MEKKENNGQYKTKKALCEHLDESVAGHVGIIGTAINNLSFPWFKFRWCRVKKQEELQKIRNSVNHISKCYVTRAIVNDDTTMKEKGYSLYSESIDKFIEKIGYKPGTSLEETLATQRKRILGKKEFPALFSEDYSSASVDELIELFRQNIDESSFKYRVVEGEDSGHGTTGRGIYSFGNLKNNGSVGLCLVYNETPNMMFFGPPYFAQTYDFYLGAYDSSQDCNAPMKKGVPDRITPKGSSFKCNAKDSESPSSKAIKMLYQTLQGGK